MKYKFSMILVSLLLIFSIGSVCAQDNNTDVISAGTEVSIDNNLLQNNLDDNSLVKLTNENVNDTLKTSNDELLTAGSNWYVNGSVTTSGDGSENSPFKTLKEAVSSAQSGDTINIASGTYTGENNTNLTISNNLNLIKYGDAEAIFDAQYLSEILIVNAETLTVNGLTFKNGNATRMINGGAINFKNKGSVINCNFTENSAYIGGAVYFEGNGTVINSIFTNNSATSGNYYQGAGAVYFNANGNVTDSKFNNNFAYYGGAINFRGNATVTNSNFNNNKGNQGGAILFYSAGNVTNCNFTNNCVSAYGGAILFDNSDIVGYVNACNFINNSAGGFDSKGWGGDGKGGAIQFKGICNVRNCNFTNNSVKPKEPGHANWVDGAAIVSSSGEVVNCNFIGNTALEGHGGAVIFYGNATVSNCIFTNNTAERDGGAINFRGNAIVINSNFIGNNASSGSAIYYQNPSSTKIISNSIFLNNRAGSDELSFIRNKDFGIQFTGNDNLINAIYSKSDVSFTNVTYWGVNGIMNTDSSTVIRSNNEAGQNITFEIYIDGVLDSNITAVTDASGIAYVSLIRDANYTVNAYHIGDSYYTTSDTVTLNFYKGSYTDLQIMIDNCTAGDTLYLPYNITFNPAYDLAADNSYHGIIDFNEGMLINKTLTIDGNGYTISGLNQARIFKVNVDNVVLNNISFVNGFRSDNSGGAIYWFGTDGTVTNCTFTNNTAWSGGAIYWFGTDGTVSGCTFTNNAATKYGGAIGCYDCTNGTIINSNFTNNIANVGGGAIRWGGSDGTVSSCTFINNTAKEYAGAIYWSIADSANGIVSGCTFINNTAKEYGGAIYWSAPNGAVSGCTFINNTANNNGGGAIQWTERNGAVSGCTFTNNTANNNGGAIGWVGRNGAVSGCTFTNNTAKVGGGAIYWYNSANSAVSGCTFTNNTANNGGAIYWYDSANSAVSGCTFTNNTANNGGAIYWKGVNGNVADSKFNNNFAYYGGAINFNDNATVTNSNFIGNNASSGSAIYYSDPSSTKIISNSIFLNNMAGSDELFFIRNKGFGIQFTGNDNLINAIYSKSDVSFTNVTYWGVNGIMNTDSSSVVRSNNEAGQNITFEIYIDGVLDSNITAVTDADGIAYVSLIRDANYTVNAYHIGDLYYTTSDTVTLNFYKGSYTDLQSMIDNCAAGDTLYLPYNITFNPAYDLAADNPYYGIIDFNGGMLINKALTIDGYGYTISGLNQARIFHINANNVVLNNMSFVNGFRPGGDDGGGAIYASLYSNIVNCNFTNNSADSGAGILFVRGGTADNCNFAGNRVRYYGGAICVKWGSVDVISCNFAGNHARDYGGAICDMWGSVDVISCNFTNNYVRDYGGAIDINGGIIKNCIFYNNSVQDGANATAVYIEGGNNLIEDSIFADNGLNTGYAIYNMGNLTLSNNEVSNIIYNVGNITSLVNVVLNSNKTLYKNIGDAVVLNATLTDGNSNAIYDPNFRIAADGNNVTDIEYNETTRLYTVDYIIPSVGDIIISTLYNNGNTNISIGIYRDKENVTLIVDADTNIHIGENATINVTLPEDALGNITVLNITVPVINGTASVVLTNMTRGNHTVSVIYSGDSKYNPNQTEVVISVSKIPTEIQLENDNITLNITDSVSTGANLIPADAGNLTYTVSNSSVVKVENGNIIALSVGSAVITVSFAGNIKYEPASNKTINVTVSKIPTEIQLENDNITLNITDSVSTGASLIPTGAGYLTYTVSNSSVVKVENGNIIALSVGSAVITVSFAGNVKYEPAENKTINVSVSLKDASISVDKNTTSIKVNDTYIIGYITSPEGLNVTFISSDESIATVDANGVVRAIAEGDAIITLSVGGDGVYAFNSTAVAVSVRQDIPKENATMNITADKITVGENLTINVELPIDATGNVTAVIEGNDYSSSVVNGTATIIIPGLSAGKYTVPVIYSGDDKYNLLTQEINVTVEDIPTVIINAPDVVKYYKGPERFVVNVTDLNGNPLVNKKVNITINGVSYIKTTDSKGIVSIALNLNSGQYNVTTTVDNQSVSSSVTIFSTVNGTDITKVFRNATQYRATFLDSEGNYLKEGTLVLFNINGIFYEHEVTGDEGLAELNINLPPGEYIITVMNLVTGENDANIITVTSTIVENHDIIKYYRNETQYTVKIIGDDANPVGAGELVTFNINGVLYNRTTNESGIAKLNINLPAGNYIITAEYKGLKMSNNITVLPVLTADDLVKKYGSDDQFVATLVDGQGKAYANQKIEFNINGVFYIRTTDSAGQAKLNIDLPVGEYIITSKYENGATKSNKITVIS